MGLGEGTLVIEVCRQAVPVFEADLEDLDFFYLGYEQQVVQRLQESLVHLSLLDEGAVLLQEGAEEQRLKEDGKKLSRTFIGDKEDGTKLAS